MKIGLRGLGVGFLKQVLETSLICLFIIHHHECTHGGSSRSPLLCWALASPSQRTFKNQEKPVGQVSDAQTKKTLPQ